MNHDSNIAKQTHDTVDKYASRIGNSAERAADTAQDALSAVSDKVESVRDQIKPTVSRMADRVDAMAQSAADGVRDTSRRAGRAMTGYVHACESYVVEQPMKAIAIAAASGAAITMLVMLSRGRSAHRASR
jgi:ElaB/YqjD/DUF883 family membrane-anchored ribosome-binding protein